MIQCFTICYKVSLNPNPPLREICTRSQDEACIPVYSITFSRNTFEMTNLFGVVRCVNVLSTIGTIFLGVVLCNFYIGTNVSVEPNVSKFRTISHFFHPKNGGNRFVCQIAGLYTSEYLNIKQHILLITNANVASNERMIVNCKFEILWKDANHSCFKVASCSLLGQSDKTSRRTRIGQPISRREF
jgi:hypothetical protein